MISDIKQKDTFENWHAFFDTCQLLRKLFPSDNEAVREALHEADALVYLPGLVIEERIAQGADGAALQRELATHAQITPVGGLIDQATKLSFFTGRSHVRFRDAAIVLSVIEFARTQGLRACVFVTEDNKLRRDSVLPRIAESQGISLYFRKSEELISLLRQAPPTLWKAILFVRKHMEQIDRYLDEHPEIKGQLIEAMVSLRTRDSLRGRGLRRTKSQRSERNLTERHPISRPSASRPSQMRLSM